MIAISVGEYAWSSGSPAEALPPKFLDPIERRGSCRELRRPPAFVHGRGAIRVPVTQERSAGRPDNDICAVTVKPTDAYTPAS